MSIEVLTRRIERLKHHIQLLDDAGVRVSGGGEVTGAKRKDSMTSDSALGGKVRFGSGGPAGRSLGAVRTAASRLPNHSFGGGASVVSRQRMALANAVQQAAARGVAQIREELLTEESALYDILLAKYLYLCDELCEVPDAQFFEPREVVIPAAPSPSDSDKGRPPLPGDSTAEESRQVDAEDDNNATNDTQSTIDISAINASTVSIPTQGRDEGLEQQQPAESFFRSNSVISAGATRQRGSVVGLDGAQRSRNSKVEQLSVACQILLSRKRKLDILECKTKEVETAANKFQEQLTECNRLLRIATVQAAQQQSGQQGGGSTTASGNTTSGAGLAGTSGPGPTKLGPLRNVPSINASSSSPANSSSSPAKEAQGLSSSESPSTNNSKKILQSKMNDAIGDIRMAVVRLMLFLKDLQIEFGLLSAPAAILLQQQLQHYSLSEDGDSMMVSGGGATDASSSPNGTKSGVLSGVAALILRKQQVIFEKLSKIASNARITFSENPDFCPPALGAVTSTPLFIDTSIFSNVQTTTASTTISAVIGSPRTMSIAVPTTTMTDGRTSPTSNESVSEAQKGAGGKGRVLRTSVLDNSTEPSMLHRKGSAGIHRRRSVLGEVSSSHHSSGAQPLFLRGGKDADLLTVSKAYDVWKTLANTGGVDIAPTAVSLAQRYVAAASHQQRAPSPTVSLRPTVIDARHPELLLEITAGGGRVYAVNEYLELSMQSLKEQHTMQMSSTLSPQRGNRSQNLSQSQPSNHQKPTSSLEDSVIAAAASAALQAVASSLDRSPSSLGAIPMDGTVSDVNNDATALHYAVHHHPDHALVSSSDDHAPHTAVDPPVRHDSLFGTRRSFDDLHDGTLAHAVTDHNRSRTLRSDSKSFNVSSHKKKAKGANGLHLLESDTTDCDSLAATTPAVTTAAPAMSHDDAIIAARLCEISVRLNRLQAHQKLRKFAQGYILQGKSSGNRNRYFAGDKERVADEATVLMEYEARHRDIVRDILAEELAIAEKRSIGGSSSIEQHDEIISQAELVSLSEVLRRRDEVVRMKEEWAVSVIVRFLRGCVVHRKQKITFAKRKIERRQKWAVRVIEYWWSQELPMQRARKCATRKQYKVKRHRHEESMKEFDLLMASVRMLQRVGRGYGLCRRDLFHTYKAQQFELQKMLLEKALWHRQVKKEVREKSAHHAQHRDELISADLRRRASIKIQSCVRGFFGRRRARGVRAQRTLLRKTTAYPVEKIAACRKIQSVWRMHHARRQCAAIRVARAAQREALVAWSKRIVAAARLRGFAKIIIAKQVRYYLEEQRLRLAEAIEQVEVNSRTDPRRALHLAKKRFDENAILKLCAAEFQAEIAGSADLVQRHLHKILKIDPSTVPKLDLEGNFLSNSSAKSLTLEREDDSFDVRMMHRLLQAPTALLYALSSFCGHQTCETTRPSASNIVNEQLAKEAAALTTFNDSSDNDSDEPYDEESEEEDDDDEDTEPSPQRSNHVLVDEESPMPHVAATAPESSMLEEQDAVSTQCRRLSFEHADECCDAGREAEPAKTTTTTVLPNFKLCPRALTTQRLTCRTGDLLLEDENGAPRKPQSLEPFAKWSAAHRLIACISEEAARYAWKMIFSHTAHDEYKQRVLRTEEERRSRLARVHQRNQLILACYDCESEAQWLEHATKNIGFVGKIWSPIRFLDQNDPDVEQRAIESYEFVDNFLLQCFPNAYSLRDVPEMLVGCGLFATLRKSLEKPFLPARALAEFDLKSAMQHSVPTFLVDRLARDVIGADAVSVPHSSSSLGMSALWQRATRSCLEGLHNLQVLSEDCVSPTVTVVENRRSPQGDETTDLEGNVGDDDRDDCGDDDDDEAYRRVQADDSIAAETPLETSDNYDIDRFRQHRVAAQREADIPDRSDTRLGFIGEEEQGDEEENDVTETQRPAQVVAECDDDCTPRDELTKQLLLEQYSKKASQLEERDEDYGDVRTRLLNMIRTASTAESGDTMPSECREPSTIQPALVGDNSSRSDATGCSAIQHPSSDSSEISAENTNGRDLPERLCTDDDEDNELGATHRALTIRVHLFPDGSQGKRDSCDAPSSPVAWLKIGPKNFLSELTERLATALMDVRVDPQMFDDV